MKINLEINLDLWVARDRDGKLYIYKHKPKRGYKFYWTVYDDRSLHFESECIDLENYQFIIPNIEDYFDFSQVKWEDDEPKQLKNILKGEYQNGK